MCLRIKYILIQTNHIRWRKYEIKVLERLGRPEALLTSVTVMLNDMQNKNKGQKGKKEKKGKKKKGQEKKAKVAV